MLNSLHNQVPTSTAHRPKARYQVTTLKAYPNAMALRARSYGGVNPKDIIDSIANNEDDVESVSLKANSLFQMKSDEYVAALGNALANNEHVTQLHLSDCGVTDAGAANLAAALESNASLTELVSNYFQSLKLATCTRN